MKFINVIGFQLIFYTLFNCKPKSEQIAPQVSNNSGSTIEPKNITISLYGMGNNTNGELGNNSWGNQSKPIQIETNVKSIISGFDWTGIIKDDNSLWMTENRRLQKYMDNVIMAAVGTDHLVFINNKNQLYGLGESFYGQLGESATEKKVETPRLISENVIYVAAGDRNTFFIKSDNSLWAMGKNDEGQLGIGNDYPRQTTPIKIMEDVQKATSYIYFSLFLKKNGELYGTGFNGSNQLGESDFLPVLIPQKITDNVIDMACGYSHSLILKKDKSLWGLGSNSSGQLGYDMSIIVDKTKIYKILSGVQNIAAGGGHSLILKTDKSLWSFGANNLGQLGDGTNEERWEPKKIDTDVLAISAGLNTSFYLK